MSITVPFENALAAARQAGAAAYRGDRKMSNDYWCRAESLEAQCKVPWSHDDLLALAFIDGEREEALKNYNLIAEIRPAA